VGDIGIVAGTVDTGPPRHLSLPLRPLRARGGAGPPARLLGARSRSPRCWATISWGSTGQAPCSASSPTRRPASAGP
jgi:hypothetical protein